MKKILIMMLVCALCSSVSAELITNGTFDTDLSGWINNLGEWNSDDADGSSSSGSWRSADLNAYILQYVPITPSATYIFTYAHRAPSADTERTEENGDGWIWVEGFIHSWPWLKLQDSSGNPVIGDYTQNAVTTTTDMYFPTDGTMMQSTVDWQFETVTIVAPANAVELRVQFNPSSPEGVLYYDNFSLTPEPATMLLLGLGGVLIRRKR